MGLWLHSCPIAICDRCARKAKWSDLVQDGNSPGLRVHASKECFDEKNPWRLAPIKPDRITLRWSRPDVPLNAGQVYPDMTDPVNPQPPADTFIQVLELEGGTGAIGLEGGGSIELEYD